MKPLLTLVLVVCSFLRVAADINPFPRPVIKTEPLLEWKFDAGAEGWLAQHDCRLAVTGGVLRIESTGTDPYLVTPPLEARGPITVRLRARCATVGSGQFFWMTKTAPDTTEDHSQHFKLIHDGQWHDYSVSLAAEGTLIRLRFDPGDGPGRVELARMELVRETLHPLEPVSIWRLGRSPAITLTNHSDTPLKGLAGTTRWGIAPHAISTVVVDFPGTGPFAARELVVEPEGLPALRRPVFLVDDTAPATGWPALESGPLAVRATPDGAGARIELAGQLVGFLAPLVLRDGAVPAMTGGREGGALRFQGSGVTVSLSLTGDEVSVDITSASACEGPVLRALGGLDQGLFAGLEYLAVGEHSSSTLDLETEEHIRYAPDPMKVTMPLMAFVTDRASAAMTWDDMTLQPVFATPDFLDGAAGHRASLRGSKIHAVIRVRAPEPLEGAILWAVNRRGLPALPAPPRERRAQLDFCLKTLTSAPLRTDAGWGHCAEPSWARQPFADQASTVWRLSGEAPSLPKLVPGGSHVRNDASYFVTGRAADWLAMRAAGARGAIAGQQPDGSYRYHGTYARGHFEDTASGLCAIQAVELLEWARLSGDDAALRAGLKALEFMRHFRDPRGAQTWECALHTPDILASAWLVQAYVLGHELTGRADYLERARAWAISGLPFVYQWTNRPVMAYATTPVYGATGWRAPNWIGLPVQWCGYDYACSLVQLAPHDPAFPWTKVATGILTAAEQMQYPEGPFAGCVPDSYNLAEQTRNGPAINPAALVSLRLRLEGKLDGLACAIADGHHVVAPFPVTIANGRAIIQARAGTDYQVAVDGRRIVEIHSRGKDEVPIGE